MSTPLSSNGRTADFESANRGSSPRGGTRHNWLPRYGVVVCKHCGIVKRRIGRNKPCPGKVRVALRENRILAASVDTHAKRGDSTQIEAPSPMGSAVPKADAHTQSAIK